MVKSSSLSVPVSLCECGCGEPAKPGRRYIAGHSLRGPKSEQHRSAIGAALRAYYADKRGGSTGKVCPRCGEFKTIDFFGMRTKTNAAGVPFLRSRCLECESLEAKRWAATRTPEYHRKHHLKWKYGISHAEYEQMLADQGGGCATCAAKEPGGRGKHFHVDHCHKTGIIRGLLCNACNSAIGNMKDSPEILRAAADYLEYHLGHDKYAVREDAA